MEPLSDSSGLEMQKGKMITFLCRLTTSLVGRKIRQVSERAEAKETNDKLSVHRHYQKETITPGLFAWLNFPAT